MPRPKTNKRAKSRPSPPPLTPAQRANATREETAAAAGRFYSLDVKTRSIELRRISRPPARVRSRPSANRRWEHKSRQTSVDLGLRHGKPDRVWQLMLERCLR